MGKSDEEKKILQKLASGLLDGVVGNSIETSGGSTVWKEIKDGLPMQYKQGPGGKFFDNRENVRFEGKLNILDKWKTDNEKLSFLQKFGWLMKDEDVKNYSSKFKPKK